MRRKSGPALKSGSGRVANNLGANALSVRRPALKPSMGTTVSAAGLAAARPLSGRS
jgi:hypothetical protein